MASLFAYRCAHCEALHEGAPQLDFDSPFLPASPANPILRKTLEDRVWLVERPGRVEHYLFGRLSVPVHGTTEAFAWGCGWRCPRPTARRSRPTV